MTIFIASSTLMSMGNVSRFGIIRRKPDVGFGVVGMNTLTRS